MLFGSDFSKQDTFIDELGIYKIQNKITKDCYVGSTKTSFFKRWYNHRLYLNKNKHHCQHLQNSWNKYGADNFSFEILEILKTDKDIHKIEQKYMDTYRDKLYNSCKTAMKHATGSEYSRTVTKGLRESSKSNNRGVHFSTYKNMWGAALSIDKDRSLNFNYETKELAEKMRSRWEEIFWSESFESLSENEKNLLIEKERVFAVDVKRTTGLLKYITLENNNTYRVRVKKKSLGCYKTLEEAVQIRDLYINTRDSYNELNSATRYIHNWKDKFRVCIKREYIGEKFDTLEEALIFRDQFLKSKN